MSHLNNLLLKFGVTVNVKQIRYDEVPKYHNQMFNPDSITFGIYLAELKVGATTNNFYFTQMVGKEVDNNAEKIVIMLLARFELFSQTKNFESFCSVFNYDAMDEKSWSCYKAMKEENTKFKNLFRGKYNQLIKAGVKDQTPI